MTFSQAINGVSPLVTHFSKTGNYIERKALPGNNVYIVDKSLIAGAVGENP